MGVKINTFFNPERLREDRTGIYTATGKYSDRGTLSHLMMGGSTSVALSVLCHVPAGKKDCRQMLLSQFKQWFESSPQLEPGAVMNWWRMILRDRAGGVALAALLIYHNQCIYFCSGDVYVYQYSFQDKCYRRFPTCSERKQMDAELGIVDTDNEDYYVQCRTFSSKQKFIITKALFKEEPKAKGKEMDKIARIEVRVNV